MKWGIVEGLASIGGILWFNSETKPWSSPPKESKVKRKASRALLSVLWVCMLASYSSFAGCPLEVAVRSRGAKSSFFASSISDDLVSTWLQHVSYYWPILPVLYLDWMSFRTFQQQLLLQKGFPACSMMSPRLDCCTVNSRLAVLCHYH